MSPAPSPRNVIGLLGAFVVTSVVAGLLAAGLAMPAVGASGVAARNSVDFFDSLPADLKTPPLSEPSTLEASDGSPMAHFYEENRDTVPLSKIAPIMQKAIVAIEDSRFYQHGGVDPKGVVRAFVVNLKSGGTEQGASTLTQQYVKNVLVETAVAKEDKAGVLAAKDKTKARKLQEIRYAVAIEKKLGKDEILNRYLNIAPFGGQIYGVQAASRYYFGVDAAKLNLVQAATLAGMVQLPTKFSPSLHPKAAQTRRDIVLRRMRQLNVIDQPTLDKALATKLKTKVTPTRSGCANAKTVNAWFCDYVYLYMTKSKDFTSLGATQEERAKTLARGGLTIRTTMDPKIAKAAWKAVSQTIRPKDKSKVATAAVTVQPGTGNVLALSENRYFSPTEGIKGSTSVNYSTDGQYGGSGGFQTGSTFKAFTLATWLKAGKSLFSTVSSATGTAPRSDFKSCGKTLSGGEPYTYTNSEGKSQGNVSVYEGTYKSINGAFVSMEKQLDLCDIADTAMDLGLHLAAPQPDECKVVPEGETAPLTQKIPGCIPSLTLGPKEIAPMTMAAAYATFASGGKYCAPRAVLSIKDRNGKNLKVPSSKCKQALDENIANTMNYGLNHVFKPGGTAARVGGLPDGRPASGKTGTANNSRQTWFAGYTPQVATAVWVGNPKPTLDWTLNRKVINGTYYSSVFGATLAAPIWKKIMTTATEGLPIEQFKKPDSKLIQGERSTVPDVSGKKVSDAIQILQQAGFKTSVNGGVVPSKYPAGTVASTSPGGGSRVSKDSTISISVSGGGGDDGGNGGGGRGNGGGGGRGGNKINPPPNR